VEPSPESIEEVRASIPRVTAARRARHAEAVGVTPESVTVIVDRGQDDYVLAVHAAGGDIGRAVVHVQQAVAETGPAPTLPPVDLAGLTQLEVEGALTATQTRPCSSS